MQHADSPLVVPEGLSQIQRSLVKLLEAGGLAPVERRKLGDALAALGDPRFSAQHWFLPDDDSLGFEEVPGGEFLMGQDAMPVNLPTFYIARFQTTQAQYRAYVEDVGLTVEHAECLAGPDNRPVVWVNWYEAIEYSRWLEQRLTGWAKKILGEAPGKTARPMLEGLANGSLTVTLPSEAEWEKAARGIRGGTYPWGEGIGVHQANFKDAALESTVAVGSYPEGKSPFGMFDASGNAWDWLRTIWGRTLEEPIFSDPYDADDGREDLGAGPDMLRCMRGGAFLVEAERAASTFRDAVEPGSRDDSDSFRVVITPRTNALKQSSQGS